MGNDKRKLFFDMMLIILLLFCFLLSLSVSYTNGLNTGMTNICGDYDIGKTDQGDYVCYDTDKQLIMYLSSVEPLYIDINEGDNPWH